jgi:hypothetical protein
VYGVGLRMCAHDVLTRVRQAIDAGAGLTEAADGVLRPRSESGYAARELERLRGVDKHAELASVQQQIASLRAELGLGAPIMELSDDVQLRICGMLG